ncbi:hypothetical protein K439DRAFT_1302604, partial [Ramaria rubella]
FPQVKAALQLAIARHEFRPGHLYKLDSTIKDKPKTKTFEISDNGDFTQHDRDASPKDYPSFHALFDPLSIYFEILQFFIIASGNIPYHFTFHSRRLAKMCDGNYSGWRVINAELASLHLYGNIKQSPHKAPSSPA